MKHQKILNTQLGITGFREVYMKMPALLKALLFATTVVGGLTACSGGGTGDTIENRDEKFTPPPGRPAITSLINPGVQRFLNTIHNLLSKEAGCSSCHAIVEQKNDAPFADPINANNAHSSALNYFDPTDPDANPTESLFYRRVEGGHHCWGDLTCEAAAGLIADALTAWRDAEINSDDPAPVETAPTAQALSDENFIIPTPAILFDETLDVPFFSHSTQGLHRLLTDYCSDCHVPDAQEPQLPTSPYFAQADATEAYRELVKSDKINLNAPAQSQLYKRIADQQHNCWGDCDENGDEILAAITYWAGNRPSEVEFNADNALVYSGAIKLPEGQETSGGQRYDTHTIAKWEFTEGADDPSSRTAADSSGIAPFIELTLNENVSWVSGYGIEFGAGGKAMSTDPESTQKLHDVIVGEGEFSVEAWVVPASTDQQNDANESISSAVIVSYSFGAQQRNFTLGQNLYEYEFYTRINNSTSANGDPVFASGDAGVAEALQATQQHVVMTYSVANGRRFYVNGEPVACETPPTVDSLDYLTECPAVDENDVEPITDLSQWNPNFLLTMGSETNNRNSWRGKIRLAAIHKKELTQANIKQNFDAGVGQKFNLLFNISSIAGIDLDGSGNSVPRSYIWFEVSEFDNFSYMFSHPQFINLNFDGIDAQGNAVTPPTINFTLKGMRIGINGQEVEVGQAFANLGKSTTQGVNRPLAITSPYPVSLTEMQGQLNGQNANDATIFRVPADATIIPKQNGVDIDQFFLTFEEIGDLTDVVVRDVDYGQLPFEYNNDMSRFMVGLRTFDEIDATMSALTGVSRALVKDDPNQDDDVSFDSLKGQLPSSEIVEGFLSSQQIAIASLSGLYCDKLVNDEGSINPATYFGVDPTSGVPGTVLSSGNINTISSNIVNNMVRDLATIDRTLIEAELASLANDLLSSCGGNFENNFGCNTSTRTEAIVKAMCTAVLGSAVVTHQ